MDEYLFVKYKNNETRNTWQQGRETALIAAIGEEIKW